MPDSETLFDLDEGPYAADPVPLATLTTFRTGGPAARYVRAETAGDVIDAVAEADAEGEPLLLIGGGSNTLVADEGFPGTVVHIATEGIERESLDNCGGAFVRVAAGQRWDDVVIRAVTEGWSGVEALSGIPGASGATPVQNVGAYGQEVADTIATVRTWDRLEGRIRTVAGPDCGFAYRTSRFKTERHRGGPRYVVLDVTFQLVLADLSAPVRYAELANSLGIDLGARAPLADVREAVLALRRSKGMVLDPADPDTWSAGSFFTNPILDAERAAALPDEAPRWPMPDGRVKVSAAWLIGAAGFRKGHGLPGPAALSTKHTLALTNRGSATSLELVALAREVRDGVRGRFAVDLVPEPVLVGLAL